MRVLITRPEPSASQLAKLLDEVGIEGIVMPLFSFEASQPDSHTVDFAGKSKRRSLVIFTSPRAVQFELRYFSNDDAGGAEIAAVGNATRKQLELAGCRVSIQAPGGYTSEDLLGMPELHENPGQAHIFCAPGGRSLLAKGLAAIGWEVKNAFVYRRAELRPAQSQIDNIGSTADLLSVWTSKSALELAQDKLPAPIWDKILAAPALVISTRLKHHLQQLGAANIELSDGPGNSDLLSSIKRISS